MKKIVLILMTITSIFLITGCSEKNASQDPLIPVLPESVSEDYFKATELTDREKLLLGLLDLNGVIYEFKISNFKDFSIHVYTVYNQEIEISGTTLVASQDDEEMQGYLLVDVSDKYMPKFTIKVTSNAFTSTSSVKFYCDFSDKIDFGNSSKSSTSTNLEASNLNEEFFFYSRNYETADSFGIGRHHEDILEYKDEYGTDRIGLVLSAEITR